MMKLYRMIAMVGLVVLPLLARAHEDESSAPNPKNVVAQKTFLAQKLGRIHVVVRNDGHLNNQDFIVEVRPDCGDSSKKWQELNVGDMTSACKVNANSLKYDSAKGVVSIEVFKIDWKAFNAQARANNGIAQPTCLKKPELWKVEVSSLCKNR